MRLVTARALAERWEMTESELQRKRRENRWPHVRLSRSDVRFTEAQIEQIIAQHSVAPKGKTSRIAGQTSRSAARSA